MKKELDQKKEDLEADKKVKQDRDYQIEFLELNFKYLETLSNNVMKKARRKVNKKYNNLVESDKAGLQFEYEVTSEAIRLEIFILQKDQKRLLETPANFQIFMENIAKYDVLNHCTKIVEGARPIFETSVEDTSVEEETDSQKDIKTAADKSDGFTGETINVTDSEGDNHIKVKLINNQEAGGKRGTLSNASSSLLRSVKNIFEPKKGNLVSLAEEDEILEASKDQIEA